MAIETNEVGKTLRRFTVDLAAGSASIGAGIVWRPDGLIVTNAHVVRSRTVQARVFDGRVAVARVLAKSRRWDLAILRAPWHDLPVPLVGDAHTLRPGDIVFAFGAPWGINESIASGVVHKAPSSNEGMGLIYVDVGLAPGNSGGPLADVAGRIVGINTAIVDGLGTAIPSHAVAQFIAQTQPGTHAA